MKFIISNPLSARNRTRGPAFIIHKSLNRKINEKTKIILFCVTQSTTDSFANPAVVKLSESAIVIEISVVSKINEEHAPKWKSYGH